MKNLDFKSLAKGGPQILIPAAVFLVMLGLTFLGGKFAYRQISSLRDKISQEKKSYNILSQKVAFLQEYREQLETGSDKSVFALPKANSSLVASSALKKLALGSGVFLSNIKTSAEVKDEDDLSRVDLTFEAEGGKEALFSFLTQIGNLAPIISIENVKITQSAGNYQAAVTSRTFFTPLPEKLPALTEPVKQLTDNEKKLVEEISKLSPPDFLEVAPTTAGKENPFD